MNAAIAEPISLAQIREFLPDIKILEPSAGAPSAGVTQVSAFSEADSTSLVYVTNARHLPEARSSRAGFLLTSAEIWQSAAGETSQIVLLTPNPELAAALLMRRFLARSPAAQKWWSQPLHSSAFVAPSARLGEGVVIGPAASVGADCVLARQVFVGAGAVIEENVTIGEGTIVHPNCYIGPGTHIGRDCEIHPNTTIGSDGYGYAHNAKGEHFRFPHLGRVWIGDRVDIGANCAIDRGTLQEVVIGEGTKIDNLCHFAHNFRCGKNCLITAHFVAAGSVSIGDNVVIGGRSSIAGHLKVASNVQIAAHSAVTTNLKQAGRYGGYPLQPLQDYLKTVANLVHLTEMRKNLAKLLKEKGAKD